MQKGFKPVSVLQLDVDKLNKRNVEQIQKQLYACNVLKIDEVQKFVDQNMVFSCFVEQQNSKILFQKVNKSKFFKKVENILKPLTKFSTFNHILTYKT